MRVARLTMAAVVFLVVAVVCAGCTTEQTAADKPAESSQAPPEAEEPAKPEPTAEAEESAKPEPTAEAEESAKPEPAPEAGEPAKLEPAQESSGPHPCDVYAKCCNDNYDALFQLPGYQGLDKKGMKDSCHLMEQYKVSMGEASRQSCQMALDQLRGSMKQMDGVPGYLVPDSCKLQAAAPGADDKDRAGDGKPEYRVVKALPESKDPNLDQPTKLLVFAEDANNLANKVIIPFDLQRETADWASPWAGGAPTEVRFFGAGVLILYNTGRLTFLDSKDGEEGWNATGDFDSRTTLLTDDLGMCAALSNKMTLHLVDLATGTVHGPINMDKYGDVLVAGDKVIYEAKELGRTIYRMVSCKTAGVLKAWADAKVTHFFQAAGKLFVCGRDLGEFGSLAVLNPKTLESLPPGQVAGLTGRDMLTARIGDLLLLRRDGDSFAHWDLYRYDLVKNSFLPPLSPGKLSGELYRFHRWHWSVVGDLVVPSERDELLMLRESGGAHFDYRQGGIDNSRLFRVGGSYVGLFFDRSHRGSVLKGAVRFNPETLTAEAENADLLAAEDSYETVGASEQGICVLKRLPAKLALETLDVESMKLVRQGSFDSQKRATWQGDLFLHCSRERVVVGPIDGQFVAIGIDGGEVRWAFPKDYPTRDWGAADTPIQ